MEVMRLKKREYVYAGEKISLSDQAASFTLAFQKSILSSLYKRNIITYAQAERCMELIKNKQLR